MGHLRNSVVWKQIYFYIDIKLSNYCDVEQQNYYLKRDHSGILHQLLLTKGDPSRKKKKLLSQKISPVFCINRTVQGVS